MTEPKVSGGSYAIALIVTGMSCFLVGLIVGLIL